MIFLGTIVYPIAFEHARQKTPVSVQPIISYEDVKMMPEITVSKPDAVDAEIVIAPKTIFTRDLKLGDQGEDVKRLQEYLNSRGFIIATSGNGSPGHENNIFGPGTQKALKKFQESHADILLKPFGLTEGTGFFGAATRNLVSS